MSKKQSVLIDTNFILRLLLKDIPSQFKKSKQLFKKIEDNRFIGLVSILVINELIWILENFYEKKRKDFIPQVLKVLSLKRIKVLEIKKKELIFILEKMIEKNLDFTDMYLLYFGRELKHDVASFDKKLVKESTF